jgi:hypothetical protein
LALVVLGAAAWFIALQAFVIRAFCPYCMTAHVGGAVMALLILLPRQGVAVALSPKAARLPTAPVRPGIRSPAFVAAGVLLVLVAGQVLYRPATFLVQPMNAVGNPATEFPTAGQLSQLGEPGAAQPAAGGLGSAGRKPVGPFLDLHAGVFRLDLGEVPLVGRRDAPHVLVSLFDYTCSHCRALHQPLVETQRALSNQLAIVSLPVPLDQTCNPTVRRQLAAHTNACVYARLGLAVWRADRQQMAGFEDWLFAGPTPPSTEAARDYAVQLVGSAALAQALKDPWGDQLIRHNARLHRTNYLLYAKGQLPQLILGTNLVVGTFPSTPALLNLVCRQFGLPLPTP